MGVNWCQTILNKVRSLGYIRHFCEWLHARGSKREQVIRIFSSGLLDAGYLTTSTGNTFIFPRNKSVRIMAETNANINVSGPSESSVANGAQKARNQTACDVCRARKIRVCCGLPTPHCKRPLTVSKSAPIFPANNDVEVVNSSTWNVRMNDQEGNGDRRTS